ncbi:MAG TPA: EAL domain-containing protein, partial [Pseudoxanthomonas sp.]|nr:EAL domain-containing protein [Pseudoxanthomonas sp.]
ASPLARPGASADRVFVLLEDVSDAHAMAREIAHQATHDELTGLINRREIGRLLGEGLAQARGGDVTHVLAFIDVDRFKLVNDTCGHAVGDRFLRRFANLLSEQLRGGDWLGRLGGDEFAVFLHGVDIGQGLRTMEEIHGLLSRTPFRWDGREMPFHCSVGLVEVDAAAADVEWLLSAADAACYLAKEEGRNRVRAYSDANRALARRRYDLDWVTSAQAAIAERRLLMYAQKIVPLQAPDTGLRYEVLVRMRGMDGVLHPPGEFLMAMERFGQATAVDGHVLDAVLGEFDRNPDHLRRLASCHVNVSAQSIADPAFLALVTERLDSRPAVAGKLCFELTETAMIGNLADARRFIDAVRERGCRVALDDFGSGLSSFAYLKDLPVDIVKIDSAFVRDIGKGGSDLAMVRSMAQVARALDKETIAEGIESAETPSRLARIGIDFVQGYAVHEPCPLEELIRQTDAGGEAWPIMRA